MELDRGHPLKTLTVRGEGVCPVQNFADKGGLQKQTLALFRAKYFRFFEIYGTSARTRGVEPVQTFCRQGGRGSIFS